MRKKNWLRYFSMLMTLVLVMSMVPGKLALAAEEENNTKIVLTSFEKLEKPEQKTFPQGTAMEELSLPKTIKAYDEGNNEYELSSLEWTIRPKTEENGEEKEDETVEPEKYDPETTAPGKYVFTLKLADTYAIAEGVKLPKVTLIIEAPETEPVTEAPTEPVTEAPTEPVTEAPTEPVTEAPTEPVTEAPTEPVTEAPTEPVTEAPTEPVTEAPTEPVTEAPTEPVTEAPTEPVTEAPTEPVTEAPTEPVTEAPTEPVTEAPTEPATEAPLEIMTEAPTEPVTEAPTDGTIDLGDAPMVELILPEKMEVGNTYQLQYQINNEELAASEELSLSYSAEAGQENIDMPDQSGNFTVVQAGPVAFQVNVELSNGTDLQAYAEGTTVEAEKPQDTETQITESETTEPQNTEPQTMEPVGNWYTGMTLTMAAPGEGEVLTVGQTYPLIFDLKDQNGNAAAVPEGMSAEYLVSDTNLAEVVDQDGIENPEIKTKGLLVKAAGTVQVSVKIGELTSAAVTYRLEVPKSSHAGMISATVGELVAVPENGVISIVLPCNSAMELSSITPKFEISENASLDYTEGTVLDFSDGAAKTFTVTAEDGVTTASYQLTVTKEAHLPGEWINEIDATCTEDGVTVQKCTVCGTELGRQAIAATGHSWSDWQIVTEATCTAEGQKQRICGVCGVQETEVIEKVPHVLGEWESIKKATCTKEGQKGRKCTVCGEFVKKKATEPLGHNTKETKRIEPTCTEAGEEQKICSRCGEVQERKTIDPLGHKWKDDDGKNEGWKVVLAPTTSSKGKDERECERCGTKETRETQRLNIIGKAENNTIWGFSNPATYPVNSVITFEAIGDGMNNTAPIKGDVRYEPASTWHLLNDYPWGKKSYSASFRVPKAGTYTLEVTFQQQTYDGSQWVNTGETSVVKQEFSISGTGQFTDGNGNGTGNTNNPDQVIGGNVKTGDNTPIVALVVVMAVAMLVLAALGIMRARKRK